MQELKGKKSTLGRVKHLETCCQRELIHVKTSPSGLSPSKLNVQCFFPSLPRRAVIVPVVMNLRLRSKILANLLTNPEGWGANISNGNTRFV